MNAFGNLLWFILGGWLIFLLYMIGTLFLFITIIGIPFGLQTAKMAQMAIFPFSYEAVPGQRFTGCFAIILNILWVLIAGIEIAVVHIVLGLIMAITIIGLPFAKQHFKLAVLGLVPFGHDIRAI